MFALLYYFFIFLKAKSPQSGCPPWRETDCTTPMADRNTTGELPPKEKQTAVEARLAGLNLCRLVIALKITFC